MLAQKYYKIGKNYFYIINRIVTCLKYCKVVMLLSRDQACNVQTIASFVANKQFLIVKNFLKSTESQQTAVKLSAPCFMLNQFIGIIYWDFYIQFSIISILYPHQRPYCSLSCRGRHLVRQPIQSGLREIKQGTLDQTFSS